MFLKNKKSVFYIFKAIEMDIIIVTVMTVIVSVLDNFFPNDQAFPLTVPSLLGTALSLILAFRTGQAYDRWWEARKIWGSIVNDSRSLVRAAEGFLQSDEGDEKGSKFYKKIALRQIGWTYSLGQQLRNSDPLTGLEHFLEPEELEELKGGKNVTNTLLLNHTKDITRAKKQGQISEFGQLRLDEIVMRLVDSMGMCERIKGTLFPTPYNRFVHITIYVFAVTLTIGITDFRGLVEIPVTIIITVIFLALERIALLLQDPWENNPSDIPVTTLAHKIETDLKQMIGNTDLPEAIENKDYYVM